MSGHRVWLDGRVVTDDEMDLAWDAPGLREGFGLFETIRVSRGRAFLVGCHAQRITSAAPRLGIAPWLHPRTVARGIDRLVTESSIGEGAVRLYVLPSEIPSLRSRTPALPSENPFLCPLESSLPPIRARYVATISDARPDVPALLRAVLAADLRDPRGPLVGLKTISRAAETLLMAEARWKGAQEALLRNLAGRLAEGTRSNLFLIEGPKLITPPLSEGLLAGVTRWLVLRLSKDAGCIPAEEPVTVERLLAADEAFMTSTLRGVVPLVAIDDTPIGKGLVGPRTDALRRMHEKYVSRG